MTATSSFSAPARRTRPAAMAVLLLALAATLGACAPGGGRVWDVGDSHAGARSPANPDLPLPGERVGPTFQEAREAGRAQLEVLYVPSRGFAYLDAQRNMAGVTVELMRDFARYVRAAHGIQVELSWSEVQHWPAFYGYVRGSQGGVFGLGNVTITEARRGEIDFSPPYLNNVAVLVTHERVPELDRLDRIGEAFRGLTALPFRGTLHEARLATLRERYLPESAARPVASNDELISLLASDGRYFGYIDLYGYWRARQAGQPLRRHRVADDASETFGVILPRGSDWTPVLESFFRSGGGYTRGERYRDHLRRHLGEELAAQVVPRR
jgi:ABC-type amino acid transport substrate-binding protein